MDVVIYNRNTGEYLTDRDTWKLRVWNARIFKNHQEASDKLFEMYGEDRGWEQGIRMNIARFMV